MVQNPPEGHNRVTPYLLYDDADAALRWLGDAFGLVQRQVFRDDGGRVVHAEMTYEGEVIMLASPGDGYKNPATQGGATVLIHLYVDDVDKHHEIAKAAGAKITSELADQEYGDRSYGAEDPEGHSWYFAQHVKDVDWGASG